MLMYHVELRFVDKTTHPRYFDTEQARTDWISQVQHFGLWIELGRTRRIYHPYHAVMSIDTWMAA
jgi:hypothetical protein